MELVINKERKEMSAEEIQNYITRVENERDNAIHGRDAWYKYCKEEESKRKEVTEAFKTSIAGIVSVVKICEKL